MFHDETADAFIVSRYDDVLQVMQDNATFSSHVATKVLPPPADLADSVTVDPAGASIINLDPPEHTGKRKIINRAFTRPRVLALAPALREYAHALVDGFEAEGRCDLMSQYANPMASVAAVDLLGLRREDIPRYNEWSGAMLGLMRHGRQAGSSITEERVRAIYAPVVEALDYFRDMLAERRQDPREDMLSVLLAAEGPDGTPAMDDEEIVVHLLSVVAAGTETSANLTASTLALLDRNPRARERVLAEPELIATALDETIRRHPSAQTVQRRTKCPVDIGGVDLPTGSLVIASIVSACNDESVFEQPERFDLDRDNLSKHLSFGKRAHFCVGAPLAKQTAAIAVEVLYERIPDLRIPEPATEFEPLRGLRVAKGLEATWTTAS
ncbi:MAG TPA: cytochrome P450 [Solirubrobacteraceae bacterium]|nr:cytochrome P450 [Solirubrobacteraceae bacterium]